MADSAFPVGPSGVPQPKLAHYPALDGLRGLAILLVVSFHYGTASGYVPTGLLGRGFVWLCCHGWVGVDLFFTLSGFLITAILLHTRDLPGGLKRFFVRRSLRIFPLYFVSLSVLLVLLPALNHPELQSAGVQRVLAAQGWLWAYAEDLAITYYNDDFFDPDPLWVGHFWSLGVEEHFYLLWPFVVRSCTRRRLTWICLALVVVAPLIRWLMMARGFDPAATYTFPLSRVDQLALGSLVALGATAQGRDRARIAPWARYAWVVGGAYVVTCVLVLQKPFYWSYASSLSLGFTALALVAASLIALASGAPQSLLARTFSAESLRILGKYSYGLYVIHTPLQPWLARWCPPRDLAALARPLGAATAELVGLVGFAVLGLLAGLALAWLSYHVIEQPFLALKERLPASPKPAHVAATH